MSSDCLRQLAYICLTWPRAACNISNSFHPVSWAKSGSDGQGSSLVRDTSHGGPACWPLLSCGSSSSSALSWIPNLAASLAARWTARLRDLLDLPNISCHMRGVIIGTH